MKYRWLISLLVFALALAACTPDQGDSGAETSTPAEAETSTPAEAETSTPAEAETSTPGEGDLFDDY